jgi:hypothetical protein
MQREVGSLADYIHNKLRPPAAQWTGAHKGPAFFAYSDNYLIDVKFGVIVDVEASQGSKGQGPNGQCKARVNPAAAASLSAANWQRNAIP